MKRFVFVFVILAMMLSLASCQEIPQNTQLQSDASGSREDLMLQEILQLTAQVNQLQASTINKFEINDEGHLIGYRSDNSLVDLGMVKGEKGDQGEQGIQGIQGEQGERGLQGLQGVAGAAGKDGADGKDGAKGEKGDKGDKGDRGESGVLNIMTTSSMRISNAIFNMSEFGETNKGNTYNFLVTCSNKLLYMRKGANGYCYQSVLLFNTQEDARKYFNAKRDPYSFSYAIDNLPVRPADGTYFITGTVYDIFIETSLNKYQCVSTAYIVLSQECAAAFSR